MSNTVIRCHYRGRLENDDPAILKPLLAQCEQSIREMINAGRMMTAALYYHGRQLFLYYEALEEDVRPEAFMGALHPLLASWPQKEETCDWAKMYNIYWHDVPRSREDWQRPVPPQMRRGRIALLKHETMWRYVYHHFAIVEEGLLQGDRYQSIAMHEDILFSYFEEPKTFTNIRRVPETESSALQGWLDVNPESHFIPLEDGKRANFMLLPHYFAIGEDNA